MKNFMKNLKLQKDIWFIFSTLIFIVVIFYFRTKDFLPYGVAFCIGYVIIICIGFLCINMSSERRNRRE